MVKSRKFVAFQKRKEEEEEEKKMIKNWIASSKSKSKGYFYNCISGPDRFKVTATGTVYFLSMVWYYARSVPRFLSEVDGGWKWLLFVISVLVTVVCCQAFLKAAFSDPGILPRGPGWETQDQMSPFRLPPVTLPVKVLGQNQNLRFCETCFMYRPPKTVHCSTCNNCVSEFGKKNNKTKTKITAQLYNIYAFYVFVYCIHRSSLSMARKLRWGTISFL